MTDTILPCPFCGGNGVIHVDYILGPNEPLYSPMCEHLAYWHEYRFDPGHKGGPKCGGTVSATFTTLADAIAAWNRRAPQPASAAMPEPDWNEAPKWATHHVFDAIGVGTFMQDASLFDGRYYGWAYHRSEHSGLLLPLGIDWRTTLHQRPEQEINDEN